MNWQRGIREMRTPLDIGDGRWSLGLRIRAAMRRARRRARLRNDLARLNERAIHDMGARRLDLEAEATKPFWRE